MPWLHPLLKFKISVDKNIRTWNINSLTQINCIVTCHIIVSSSNFQCNIDNMNVLFNIQNLNNINVQNDRLLNIDPDHNHDCQLPNCNNVDPNACWLTNYLQRPSVPCHLILFSSLKKHFQSLQTEITDHFYPSVIGLCETKIDSNIEQLYNLAGYNLITNNNQLNKGLLALYIKSNIPVTLKLEQRFIRMVFNQFFPN